MDLSLIPVLGARGKNILASSGIPSETGPWTREIRADHEGDGVFLGCAVEEGCGVCVDTKVLGSL